VRSIEHFIITRFNLRPARQEGGRQLDPEWLGHRFDLFDRFCFPTVRGQTEQGFRWLVLFDSQTPEPARARIREYQRWPSFIPVYFPAGSDRQAHRAVAEHLGRVPDILVTTRLDNDDGVSRTFVEDVRRHVDVAAPTVLEFPVGYVWHRDRVYLDRQPHNPFTTLAEPLDGRSDAVFRTIYGGSHHDAELLGRVVEVTERPSWVQVIHEGNRFNHVRGIRHSIRDLSPGFDIEHRGLAERENRLALSLDRARTTVRTGTSRVWLAARAFAKRRLAAPRTGGGRASGEAPS
jgi:hypothetical protein